MCGIAGFSLSAVDAAKVRSDLLAESLLMEIEYRGRDATGIAWWGPKEDCASPDKYDKDQLVVYGKQPLRVSKYIEAGHCMVPNKRSTAILHTRKGTKGSEKVPGNNHPILYGNYMGVHNGWIMNDDELFAELKAPRHAQVDSEAIWATLTHADVPNDQALMKLEGAAALAWLRTDVPDMLWLARVQGTPLSYAVTAGGSLIFCSTSSDLKLAIKRGNAGLDWEKDIVAINEMIEGEMLSVKEGKVCFTKYFEPPSFQNKRRSASSSSTYIGGGGTKSQQPYAGGYTGSSYGTVTHADGSKEVTSTMSGGGYIGGSWKERARRVYCTHYSPDGKVKKVVDKASGREFPDFNTYKTMYEPTAYEARISGGAIPWYVLESDFFVRTMPFEVFEGEYTDRLNTLKDLPEVTDLDLYTNLALVRPGMWLTTEFLNHFVDCQVLAMPDTYPDGVWVVRAEVGTDPGHVEFVALLRGTDELYMTDRTIASMRQALENGEFPEVDPPAADDSASTTESDATAAPEVVTTPDPTEAPQVDVDSWDEFDRNYRELMEYTDPPKDEKPGLSLVKKEEDTNNA